MIKKESFRAWAESKFWSDRCAAVGAIMDAMDGFGAVSGMTQKQRLNFEIIHAEFWDDGGLDMAYQEYLERDLWERSLLGTALRIYYRFGGNHALAYCFNNDNYHRFGRPLEERFIERVERAKKISGGK